MLFGPFKNNVVVSPLITEYDRNDVITTYTAYNASRLRPFIVTRGLHFKTLAAADLSELTLSAVLDCRGVVSKHREREFKVF